MKTVSFEFKPSGFVRAFVWDDGEHVGGFGFGPAVSAKAIVCGVLDTHSDAKLHPMYANRKFPAKAGMVRKLGQIVAEGRSQ